VAGYFTAPTGFGGTMNGGTLFSLAPPASASDGWTESVLYNFTALKRVRRSISAVGPSGLVDRRWNGTLYGTTAVGGSGTGGPYCPEGCGTCFSLTPPAGGAEEHALQLHPWHRQRHQSHCGCSDRRAWREPGAVRHYLTGKFSIKGGVFSLAPPLSLAAIGPEAVLLQFPRAKLRTATADPAA